MAWASHGGDLQNGNPFDNEDKEVGLGHSARVLTKEELEKLKKDQYLVSEFKQRKYEIEAQKNWDLFYKRNTTKFFKDRHWTRREFSELFQGLSNEGDNTQKKFLEVGCGVGNFMFPLLEEDPSLFFYACDFSHRAVQFVKENPQYNSSRCNAFQCDLTEDELTNHIAADSLHAVSMIFVLSAIHPDKMSAALSNIFKVLRPGGHLVFRDYGLYDYAMLRFSSGHKLSDRFYVRQDGTRAYYFTVEFLTELVEKSGFQVNNCDYVKRQTVNKKEGLSVPRIFVQGQFVKPIITDKSEYMCESSDKSSTMGDNSTTIETYRGDNSDISSTTTDRGDNSEQRTRPSESCSEHCIDSESEAR